MAAEKNEVKEEVKEKKVKAPEEPAEEVKEKKVKAPEEPAKEKKVTIRIPRSKDKQGDVFVAVNERTFLIQRGVPVSVPECVAEVLATSERYEEEGAEYNAAMQK